jgi:hypothetical protein
VETSLLRGQNALRSSPITPQGSDRIEAADQRLGLLGEVIEAADRLGVLAPCYPGRRQPARPAAGRCA